MMKVVDGSAARRMARPSRRLRGVLVAAVAALGVLVVPAVSQAQTRVISDFQAGPCAGTPEPSCPNPYTQAAGHPDYAVTGFTVATDANGNPVAQVKDVRTDIPAGLLSNPQATAAMCTETQLSDFQCPAQSQVGQTFLTTIGNVTLQFPVYNITITPDHAGAASVFGFNPILGGNVYVLGYDRTTAQGGSADDIQSGDSFDADFGEYFEIDNLPTTVPIVKSALVFFGNPSGALGYTPGTPFLTMPSQCAGPQTSYLSVDTYQDPGDFQTSDYTTPEGASGCNGLTFPTSGPLAPSLTVTPVNESGQAVGSVANDSPAGVNIDIKIPQPTNSTQIQPEARSVTTTLPPGFSINPGAGASVQTCSDIAFNVADPAPGNACAGVAPVGTVSITTPLLSHPLTGNVYLGQPLGPDTGTYPATPGTPYRLFVDAEQTGVTTNPIIVRLEGTITADPSTGQLTTTFDTTPQLPTTPVDLQTEGVPQVPFSDLSLTLDGGPTSVLASPLACTSATASASLDPYSDSNGSSAPPATLTGSVTVAADNSGSPCPSTPPFQLTPSISESTAQAGAATQFVLNVTRPPGQQYLSSISATLPAGLLGSIASVPLCSTALAEAGACPASSEIGTTTVTSGAGSSSVTLSGTVYLTGPVGGYPFGMSIVVPAVVGPYDLGSVPILAGISINPTTSQLTITSDLPQVLTPPAITGYGGVPLRVQSVSIAITRPNFLTNPTSCGPLTLTGTLGGTAGTFAGFGSTIGATQAISVPFQVANCAALPFTPTLTATTNGVTTQAAGASLEVKLTQPAGQANTKSVSIQIPSQLAARYETEQNACPAATFAKGPSNCPASTIVGQVTATTPLLPGSLTGPAYYVYQTGVGLPNIDVVLTGDGVTFDLTVSNNLNSKGLVSSLNAPDVPISSFELNFGQGPHSLLSANGALCGQSIKLATTLDAQSGASKTVTVPVTVANCSRNGSVGVLGYTVTTKHIVKVSIKVPAAGRVTGSGKYLKTTRKTAKQAGKVTLSIPLTIAGVSKLQRKKTLKLKVKVAYVPSAKGFKRSTKTVNVTVRNSKAKAKPKKKRKK